MAALSEYRYPHFKRRFVLEDMTFRGGPKPGEELPDFDLITVAGSRIRKQDFIGKRPILITFGSVTCPMTKSAGPILKRLHDEFGNQVEFITLYVREAHPGNRLRQVESLDEKLEFARRLRDRDQISWTVAVDSPEGDLHRRLGEHPNAAYLADQNGKVTYRALWSNSERALRKGLRAIVNGQPTPIGESKPKLIPMLSGLGVMYETLNESGKVAKRDLLKQTPPMYFMARVASVFRPLSPLGRGIAALATTALTVAGIGGLIRRQRRLGR